MPQLRIGLIGTGVISGAYFAASRFFRQLEIATCADVNQEAAEARGREFGIKAQSVDALLTDKSIDVILNLTTPRSHVPVNLKALDSGKHAYSEKPFGLTTAEAAPVIELARTRGLRVGCAPDTFLSGGQQTARRALDSGMIGRPFGGTAFILIAGHESWHPNPDFYYQEGGGPVYDMGVYYLTALVNLLGPISRIDSAGGKAFSERVIGSGARKGQRVPVSIPTHLNAILEFACNATVLFGASFDVAAASHPPIEIFGTEGTLQVPDPNKFVGTVRVGRGERGWQEVPSVHPFGDRDYRGVGLAEMVESITENRPHRASDQLAFHVLEVMEAIVTNVSSDRSVSMTSTCVRPRPIQPLPAGGSLE